MKKLLRNLSILLAIALLSGLLPAALAAYPEHEHDWIEKSRTEATCAKEGRVVSRCRVCGEEKTETLKKKAHTWGKWQETKEATCESRGEETRKCRVCGKRDTRKTDRKAHTWGKWTVTKEPTDFSMGARTRACRVCGREKEEKFYPEGTLRRGDRGADVKALQEKLNAAGYDCGTADGDFGRKTEAAVRAIEEARGMEADGIAWPGVQKWLEAAAPAVPDFSDGDSASLFLSRLRNLPPETGGPDDPLRIVTQPVGGVISHADGESLTLTVEAEGGAEPYTYTWRQLIPWMDSVMYRDLMPIVGGDAPTLTVTEGGTEYFCVVTDSAGEWVRSDTASVNGEFAIVEQPKNANLYGRASVTLTCRAAGGERYDKSTYIYAWYDSADSQVGFSDEGSVEISKEGEYFCVVQDLDGRMMTSDTVTVYSAIPLTVQGISPRTYMPDGETRDLEARAGGGVQPLSGTWTRDGETVSPAAPGAQVKEGLDSWLFPALADAFGTYTFTVTDAMGEEASATVAVEYDQLDISVQPAGGSLSHEGKYQLSIAMAEGEKPLTFTLYRDGEVAGEETVYARILGWTVDASGEYRFHVTDADGRWADSGSAYVKDYGIEIAECTEHAEIAESGGHAKLRVKAAGGEGTYSYEWRRTGSDHLIQRMNMDYTTVKLPGEYTCVVTDSFGASAMAVMDVTYAADEPLIVRQPEDLTLEGRPGDAGYEVRMTCAAVNADAAGDGLRYDWEMKTDAGWVPVPNGRDTDTLEYGGTGREVSRSYRCVVTDTARGSRMISREASVRISLTCVQARQVGTGSRLIFEFAGGCLPFRVTAVSSGINFVPDSDGISVEQVEHTYTYPTEVHWLRDAVSPYVMENVLRYTNWFGYDLKGDLIEIRAPMTYTVTVTDGMGQTATGTVTCELS